MNFEFSAEQIQIQDLARKSAFSLLMPKVQNDEEEGVFRPQLIQELGQLGLVGLSTPEHLGGAGLGSMENVLALEEIAAVSLSYGISVAVTGLPQTIINEFGTEAQKKKYIPPLARGEHIGAFALSESFSGSDAASLKTKAEKKGRDYILNGTKLWCTQGNVADTLIVFARTGDAGAKGISAFIVEKSMHGFKTGKVEKKMGLNISPTCELIFENVKIPAENLIGSEGTGFKIAMAALDCGRINIGACSVGVARAAYEYALKFSRERKQFGSPIGDFQSIQFMLADMFTQIEASRLLVQKTAYLKDQGRPFTLFGSAAKLFSSDTAMKVTTDAVQILGGVGYTQEYPVERYMREAKVLQIVEGTNQIQRIVIGKFISKSI